MRQTSGYKFPFSTCYLLQRGVFGYDNDKNKFYRVDRMEVTHLGRHCLPLTQDWSGLLRRKNARLPQILLPKELVAQNKVGSCLFYVTC